MDKIRNYVDNMFFGIPKTQEAVELRLAIQDNMAEKYEALRAEGRSENEALGMVFSEFGSMEEIRRELGVSEPPALGRESFPQAEYDAFRRQYAIAIATGVSLCILSIVLLIALAPVFGDDSPIPVIVFFLVIAAAVFLFVYYDLREERYTAMRQALLPPEISARQRKQQRTANTFYGVIMLLATAIFLFFGFVFGSWHPGWAVFPIGAVLCGIVAVIFRTSEE